MRVWQVTSSGARIIGEDELNSHLQFVDEWERKDRHGLFKMDGIEPAD